MNLLDIAAPYITHYGYWAVFFVIFLESLGIPLPGETFLLALGLLCAKGMLNPLAVLGLTLVATVSANNITYALGYWGGERFVAKYGKYIFLTDETMERMKRFIKRRGHPMLIFARFIIGLRQVNGIVLGTIKSPWKEYALYNFIGAIIWVFTWVMIPYFFGKTFCFDLRCLILLGVGLFLASLLAIFLFNKESS